MISAEGNDPGYSPLSFNFGTEWREREGGCTMDEHRKFISYPLGISIAYLG